MTPLRIHRLIQANLNHSARAQDLLVQTMAEWDISIGIVAEPYMVRADNNNWTSDELDSIAIIIRRGDIEKLSPPLTTIGRGEGYVMAGWGDWIIIGVYFSPNKNLSEFEQFLDRVEIVVRQSLPGKVIVAGDLNAKSKLWGSPATDIKGELLEEWAASFDLICQNKGSALTCVRQHGGSIVDVTFASPIASNMVNDWWVEEKVETLSDHKYVRMDMRASTFSSHTQVINRIKTPQRIQRWVTSKMDKDAMKAAAIAITWPNNHLRYGDVHSRAMHLRNNMIAVCDAGMPRAKPYRSRRNVYW